MRERQENLQASILDRLIDDEPEVSTEGLHSRGVSMRLVESSLLRDLENLLNTRRNILEPPAAYGELNRSLYTYGLRDYTAENPNNPAVIQNMRREIAQSIALFEPRLKNVVVQIDAGREGRELFFRIVGTMVVESFAEPVAFDIQLDPNRGEFLISR
jgi:type VI secretion system protein ImpF